MRLNSLKLKLRIHYVLGCHNKRSEKKDGEKRSNIFRVGRGGESIYSSISKEKHVREASAQRSQARKVEERERKLQKLNQKKRERQKYMK